MSSRNFLRALVVASLVVLPALPAHAVPLDGARFSDDRGAFAGFLGELRSFWLGLFGKEGMLIDPHGTASVLMKEGMTIDPSGQPAGTNSDNDNGMLIDPHG